MKRDSDVGGVARVNSVVTHFEWIFVGKQRSKLLLLRLACCFFAFCAPPCFDF